MPHRQPKDLIDALIDQELDEETAKEVRKQLENDRTNEQKRGQACANSGDGEVLKGTLFRGPGSPCR